MCDNPAKSKTNETEYFTSIKYLKDLLPTKFTLKYKQ